MMQQKHSFCLITVKSVRLNRRSVLVKKMCFIFFTMFVWNIFHLHKFPVSYIMRCLQKCMWVFIYQLFCLSSAEVRIAQQLSAQKFVIKNVENLLDRLSTDTRSQMARHDLQIRHPFLLRKVCLKIVHLLNSGNMHIWCVPVPSYD
jgi:hypothetical protein